MDNFDTNSKKLKSRLGELRTEFHKMEGKCSFLYFTIVIVGLITLLFLIGFLMYQTGSFDLSSKVLTPVGVVLFALSLSLKEHFIYKFSKKLRNINQDINDIVLQLNNRREVEKEELLGDILRWDTIENLPRADYIPELTAYENKLIEKITKVIGIISLITGGLSAIASTIIVDHVHPLVFGIMLVMGTWLHIYGYFAMFTKRPISSMYWPTIAISSLTIPPLLSFLITMNFEQWINILFTCIGAGVGLILFTIILRYKVTKPNKIKNDYLLQNRHLFYIVDISRLNDYHYNYEMRNLKNDYVWDKISKASEHILVLMKYVDGEYIFVEEIKSVDFLTAKYEAAKKLVDLYNEKDGRPIFEFDESIADEITLNIRRLSHKLKELNFLNNKIEVIDDTITITFNKYLEVVLSDDYCSYLNTHFHPTMAEGFQFISQLINEDIVFVQSIITRRWKSYPGYYIDELLKKYKTRQVRVFSAVKIYKE